MKEKQKPLKNNLTDDDWQSIGLMFNTLSEDSSAWKAEAINLLKILKDDSLSDLPKIEAYLRQNPPSAGAMGFLVLIAKANVKSEMARSNALIKISKDPKQDEKKFVHSCWVNWQENPKNYDSKAAFARDMLDKCQHLISHKIITDWCRKWEECQSASMVSI